MTQDAVLYQGKTKTLYRHESGNCVIAEFRDDITAGDGEKHETMAGKGALLSAFNAFFMTFLNDHGIETALVERLDETRSVMQHLEMVPVEVVIRNRAAGSFSRRLGVERGEPLTPPIVEYFWKNDALHDPMVTASHAVTMKLASPETLQAMADIALKVNAHLVPLFANANLSLVDFKLEFGRNHDQNLVLGDEISPDSCRIWAADSDESLDKDRFRQSLGGVMESYRLIAERLGVPL